MSEGTPTSVIDREDIGSRLSNEELDKRDGIAAKARLIRVTDSRRAFQISQEFLTYNGRTDFKTDDDFHYAADKNLVNQYNSENSN